MFSAEIVIKRAENRRSVRNAVDMPGRVTTEGSWRSVCRIEDISMHGARLSTFSAIPRGTVIWLNMPGQPARKAEVVWADDFTAACQFFQPLDERSVVSLVGYYGFTAEPERPVEEMVMIA